MSTYSLLFACEKEEVGEESYKAMSDLSIIGKGKF